MKAVYVSSLVRMLDYEQIVRKNNPPEVMGYRNSSGRRMLSRGIFGLYEELCSIGEKEEADAVMARYKPAKIAVRSAA